MPPSEWYDRVVDELLNLLPEDTEKATTRMRYVLMLIPDNYDYTKDKIIVQGVKRVLQFETEKLFNDIRMPRKKPIDLVISNSDIKCDGVYKGSYQSLKFYNVYMIIPGTKVVYDDGSSYEPRVRYMDTLYPIDNGYVTSDLIGNNPRDIDTVTGLLQKNPKYRNMVITEANERFLNEKKHYNEDIAKLVAKTDDILKAGRFLGQLSELSGDSKWIADKSRLYNDILRCLESNSY